MTKVLFKIYACFTALIELSFGFYLQFLPCKAVILPLECFLIFQEVKFCD